MLKGDIAMDMRQLRYFLAIAQEGQITRAAKQLNMEQPPLSRQLKLMEQELGVILFDRNGKQLQLTQPGRRWPNKGDLAHESIRRDDHLRARARRRSARGAGDRSGRLLHLLGASGDPPFLGEVSPQVTFKIQEGDHFLLGELLENRDIELILTRLPFQSDFRSQHYSVLPLPSDPFVAVVPSEWSPDPAERSMSLRQLARLPFLTLKTERTTGMHDRVFHEFRWHSLEPRIISECSSVAITVSLVASGIGVAILPGSVMNTFESPRIKKVAISDAEFRSNVGIQPVKGSASL